MPYATPAMAEALGALITVLPDGRRQRPRGVRHRVGEGQGLARGHHQRLRRGLPRRARREGRVGVDGVLREPREDRRHPGARAPRAVVRGPHAVGPEVPQGGRHGRQRQRHRRGRRERRFRPADADRRQPAERRARPGTARQQVDLAGQRDGGLRAVAAGVVLGRVLVDARGGRARGDVERRGLASWPRACTRSSATAPGRPTRRSGRARRRRCGSTTRRSKRRAPTWWRCTSCRTRSSPSWASSRRRTRPRSPAPSTRPSPGTRWCSCAACARARTSKKTTCATASSSCGGS